MGSRAFQKYQIFGCRISWVFRLPWLCSALALLTPPPYTSSPLSPNSTSLSVPPQAPTPWAGSLRSRCVNRSRCLAATPAHGPVIQDVETIPQETFDDIPPQVPTAAEACLVSTEALMAAMATIHEQEDEAVEPSGDLFQQEEAADQDFPMEQ